MLPEIKRPTELVDLGDGATVTIRALTIYEVRRLKNHPDENESDALAVQLSVGDCTLEEAQAWLESIPAPAAQALIEAILRLAGLLDAARFQGAADDDARHSRQAG